MGFIDYINEEYYDVIYKEIECFYEDNKEILILNKLANHISKIDDIEIETINFKNCYIESKEEDDTELLKTKIIVGVTASYSAYEYRYKCYEKYYTNEAWLTLDCIIKFDGSKFTGFKILTIDEYSKFENNNLLTEDFIPLISKENYELYANKLLKKFYPEAIKSNNILNPYVLVSRMKLKLIKRRISKENNILGLYFFEKTIATFYNESNNQYYEEIVDEDTIVLDEYASSLYSFNCSNITIVHECVHAFIHKKTFKYLKACNKDLKYIKCKTNGEIEGLDSFKNKFIEIQANAIASMVIMPSSSFRIKLSDLIRELSIVYGSSCLDYGEELINELSKYYGVTKIAIKNRMIGLGYSFAQGLCNFVDNHYVKPYLISNNSLKDDETFIISKHNLLDLLKTDQELHLLFLKEKVLFIDNHIVINDQKFLFRTSKNKIQLTEYAREHIDECCLKLRISYSNNQDKIDINSGYLCRDLSKKTDIIIRFINRNTYSNRITLSINKEYFDLVKELKNGIFNKSFKDSLVFLLDFLDVSTKELSIDTGIDESNINKYKNGHTTIKEIDKLIAICVALKLPPSISEILLKNTGLQFKNSDRDELLYSVLSTLYCSDVADINKLLIDSGFKPLTSKKE